MKIIKLVTILSFVSLATFGLNSANAALSDQSTSTNHLTNFKEKSSKFAKKINPTHVRYFYSRFGKKNLLNFLRNSAMDKNNYLCASSWIKYLRDSKYLRYEQHLKTLIYIMRQENIIDDITTDILLKARVIRYRMFFGPSLVEEKLTFNREKVKSFFAENSNLIFEGCGEDSWKKMRSSILKKKLFNRREISLRNFFYYAKKHNYISTKIFKEINKYRASDVSDWSLTLKKYYNKRESIEKNIDNSITSSEFVSKISDGSTRSLRQRLYERYSTLQIKVLAGVLITLKKRFEAVSSNIVINYGDKTEIIELNEMERFRMNLKLMRKELSDLNNSAQFSSRPASYFDIIAASYELNYVSAEELDYLGKYKEIWSPKETKSQKIMYWVKSLGSVGAVLIPQPFDFLLIMGLMVIDGVVKPKVRSKDKSYSIF